MKKMHQCLRSITILNELKKIAKEYNVELVDMSEDYWCRNGGHSAGNTISIHPCDEEWMYELSFWHELGHILLNRLSVKNGNAHHMSTISNEGAAWELGLIEAAKHKRTWDFYSKEIKWCRSLLASYVNGEYDELKEYYKQQDKKV